MGPSVPHPTPVAPAGLTRCLLSCRVVSLPSPQELPLPDAISPSKAPTGQRPGPNIPSGAWDGDFALLGTTCQSHTLPWLSRQCQHGSLQVLPCCRAPAALTSRWEGQAAATDHPCPLLRWRNAPGIVSITSPSLPALQQCGSPCHTQDQLQKEVVRALVLWRQGHLPTQEPAVPVPVSAKPPLVSFYGAVALPGFSCSWNISVPLRQGSPGGSEVPDSDTEPWAHLWATSLTLPFPCCFWG